MIGVLVMAYGGPDSLEDVEPYLLDVRGGRPTPAHVVETMRERYRQIGGRSPILERTRAQAQAIETALNRGVSDSDEPRFKAVAGMRHWRPYIREALAELAEAGIERAVGLVMAPHYSKMSIGAYFENVNKANSPIEVAPIERWNLLPGYIEAQTDRVRAALARFAPEAQPDVPLIFTAHSLPQRILEWNDPYPDELRATMEAVMACLGPRPHELAFQSAAMTPEPWLGPDAGEVLKRLAREGQRNAIIAPIGFVCDHVEVLYDVDIEYAHQAQGLGIHLERTEMVNTAPAMIEGLAGLVRSTVEARGWL